MFVYLALHVYLIGWDGRQWTRNCEAYHDPSNQMDQNINVVGIKAIDFCLLSSEQGTLYPFCAKWFAFHVVSIVRYYTIPSNALEQCNRNIVIGLVYLIQFIASIQNEF